MITRAGLLRLAGALALMAAALVPAPAAAQSPPTISISPAFGRAGSSGTWSFTVSGSGFFANNSTGTIGFAGTGVASFTTNGSGAFGPVTVTTGRRGPGAYAVFAFQPDPCAPRAVCGTRSASATFSSIDGDATDEATGRTDCSPAGTAFSLRVRGVGFPQSTSSGGENRAYVDFQRNGARVTGQIRIPIAKDGSFVTSVAVPSQSAGATYSIYVYDLNKYEFTLPWGIPCPTGPTTTTTTRPTATVPTTTTTTAPTVAATLRADPPLGPPGFVTVVSGTGFPAGPVQVRWEGGIGATIATAGADGSFSTQLLVLPGDRTGPRAVVAKAGSVEVPAAFLVVPSTVSPSGRDVSQINRIRRLGNR